MNGRLALVAAIVALAWPAPSLQDTASAQAGRGQAARRVAELPGVSLSYLDAGSGVPVVLLHSATGSSRVWEHQLPALTRAGYRVIAYDRRGHGESVARPATGSTAMTAADDLEALAAHLGLARFHLLGTAAGGIVATDYALSFPGRLRSLVVANSLVGVQDDSYAALGRRLRPSPQFDALPPDFRELGPAYRAANPEGVARWLELERTSRPEGTRPPAIGSKSKATFAALEGLRVPTLMLTGDADLYTPPPVLQLFAQRLPDVRTVVIDGAGHSAYWEQPEVFNRAVLDFIRRR
jgi:pimeloyl-ACP methyl ester carboxylesterase